MPDNLDTKEIFEGKDKRWGLEICQRLRSEGLGVPVIYQDRNSKKIDVIHNQNRGERDESIRMQERTDDTLLGVILTVDKDRKEFVFLSAGSDQGVVFQDSNSYRYNQYLSDSSPYLLTANETSFTDVINHSAVGQSSNKIVLKEDSDPSRYAEIVAQSVESARQKQLETMQRRGEIRKSIFQKLFGGE